ncbi:sulfurtransferase [Rhodovulum sulfidophilum]|uniref:sulfurtransferase n=1 Tax=Rhodovulum sulfidophilum TaxID=35806 RepID=UPI00192194F6|nr:rhodanese-like domain-containing protein [Rhodovulum sulfidophilum]MBL3561058.1 sulfurtransferase [Rhodovulum sulfidophilum]
MTRHAPSAAFALALLAGPALSAPDFGPLIEPRELADALDAPAPLVLDIRTGPDGAAPVFEAGHVPGAISAPYGLFRGPAENPGQLIPEDRLTEVLRSLGVTRDRPTVIVHQGSGASDFGAAARVYWTLKSSGVSALAILNGGMAGWNAAGLTVETGPALAPAPSDIEVSFSHDWLATTEDVEAIVAGKAEGTLIDARPEPFWAGNAKHPAAFRPGTLPQSRPLPHSGWFEADDPARIAPEAAAGLAAANHLGAGDAPVSFCNTGHWAATNWFALSELAGIEGVRLYPESMVGWTRSGHEAANVPGPLRNLWNRLRGRY